LTDLIPTITDTEGLRELLAIQHQLSLVEREYAAWQEARDSLIIKLFVKHVFLNSAASFTPYFRIIRNFERDLRESEQWMRVATFDCSFGSKKDEMPVPLFQGVANLKGLKTLKLPFIPKEPLLGHLPHLQKLVLSFNAINTLGPSPTLVHLETPTDELNKEYVRTILKNFPHLQVLHCLIVTNPLRPVAFAPNEFVDLAPDLTITTRGLNSNERQIVYQTRKG